MRRETDPHDARRIRLYPTALAHENLQRLRDVWSRLLDGIVPDPEQIETVTSTLRGIEAEPTARARRDARQIQ